MKHIAHTHIVKAGHFLKLFKNDAQFSTPIFRRDKKRKNLQFVIVFKDANGSYALNHSQQGYSSYLKRLKTFSQKTLYQGILSVPAKARASVQVLQVPSDRKVRASDVTYYSDAEIEAILSKKKVIEEVYDPFRDAHSVVFLQDTKASEMTYEDYQGIQDFHPFLTLKDQATEVFCTYQDHNKNQAISLSLMGWYYLGQQLKISWKPNSQPKARWRSSLLAIDKKTKRYFFQGNIYQEKGTDPVFLENLTFQPQKSRANSQAVAAEFQRLIQEIKQQERAALLTRR